MLYDRCLKYIWLFAIQQNQKCRIVVDYNNYSYWRAAVDITVARFRVTRIRSYIILWYGWTLDTYVRRIIIYVYCLYKSTTMRIDYILYIALHLSCTSLQSRFRVRHALRSPAKVTKQISRKIGFVIDLGYNDS